MRRLQTHHRLLALLGLALVAGVAAPAWAATSPYVHPMPTSDDKPPTPMDMVTIGGYANTIAVRILNLTPYELVADHTGITTKDCTDRSRSTHKSFMYAPVGWPKTIPGLAGQWQPNPQSPGHFTFVPQNPNHTVHPYNFVLAFIENAGDVKSGDMAWTVKQVFSDTHQAQDDVQLRLWITRTEPKQKERSGIFKVITAAVMEIVDLVGLAVEPENPIAWIDLFVATKELANASFEAANSDESDGGEKLYAACYMVPQHLANNNTPMITYYDPDHPGDATDGVDVQWGGGGGVEDYSSQVVVTSHLLRNDYGDGTAPILAVTLWTPDMWRASTSAGTQACLTSHPAGRRVNAHLSRDKRHGMIQFMHLYNSLDREQRAAYGSIQQALFERKHLTPEQVAFLEEIAAALEKGNTTLKGEPTHEAPEHEHPSHERPAGHDPHRG